MNDAPAKHDPAAAAQRIYALAEREGFGLVGIAEAKPTDHAEELKRWIAEGHHGEMHYLAEQLHDRLDPARLLEGARSIVALGDFYESHEEGREKNEEGEAGRTPSSFFSLPSSTSPAGRIARYAWGSDYHRVTKKRLHRIADALRAEFPGYATRSTVDTAPMLEREHAMRAGLGWQGKNTMLIHPRLGSFFLLGTIITTLELQPSADAGWPEATVAPTDHCGTCTRCIDACPTHCITSDPAPGSPGGRRVDASRCISYLTLEHRGAIKPELHAAMGDWVAGCDVCQEVCPFNKTVEGGRWRVERDEASRTPSTPHPPPSTVPVHPRLRAREDIARGLPLLDVLGWTEADRRAAFVASALKRVKLEMMKRNALIALGNHLAARPDEAVVRRIEAVAEDAGEPELVRVTARQVLARVETAASARRA